MRNKIPTKNTDSQEDSQSQSQWEDQFLDMVHFDSHPDLGGVTSVNADEYENPTRTFIKDLVEGKPIEANMAVRLQDLYSRITNSDVLMREIKPTTTTFSYLFND